MKRFWSEAAVAPGPQGLQVLLDGVPMRLPGGAPLALQGAVLAEAVAAEWRLAGGGPGGTMSLDEVPLTRLAGTAQGRVAPDPQASVDALARYGEADLLCYRAAAPDALAALQAGAWQPWLDWAAAGLGARLLVTRGVTFVAQPPAALAALRAAVAGLPVAGLAGLGVAVPALGSLVLGLALAAGRLEAEAAHAAATLEERFQAGRWGEDREALARARAVGQDVALAARFMALAAAGDGAGGLGAAGVGVGDDGTGRGTGVGDGADRPSAATGAGGGAKRSGSARDAGGGADGSGAAAGAGGRAGTGRAGGSGG